MYPAFSLVIPENLIKSMNQTNFNFIWKNRHHYLRKRDVLKSLEEGDLNVIDYEAMNGVVKLNGYRNSYKIVRASGLIFHLKYLINVEGLIFLPRCDFSVAKLPIKLSKFHEQVLLYWKMIYKHRFTHFGELKSLCHWVGREVSGLFYI